MVNSTLIQGDSRAILAILPTNYAHAIATDPPYNLFFLGKDFVPFLATMMLYQRWVYLWAHQALRVLKPGGHMLVFGGTRTWHRMACGIEDAGFELRDTLMWLYGTGFPKSYDLGQSVEKLQTMGKALRPDRELGIGRRYDHMPPYPPEIVDTGGPAQLTSDDARRWVGWGTALKPAWEPILIARKPLSGPVAANVLEHGAGGLNIDATRIGVRPVPQVQGAVTRPSPGAFGAFGQTREGGKVYDQGRWPANVILDEEAGEILDAQSGQSENVPAPMDTGGASRFFYCPKASRRERELGCDDLSPVTGAEAVDPKEDTAGLESPRAGAGRTARAIRNPHPTVKPVNLMRWLVRLVCPAGGVVIDPFVGSGTTLIACNLEGVNGVGIDMDAGYLRIAAARIAHWPEYCDACTDEPCEDHLRL